jgi:hypothetical protein
MQWGAIIKENRKRGRRKREDGTLRLMIEATAAGATPFLSTHNCRRHPIHCSFIYSHTFAGHLAQPVHHHGLLKQRRTLEASRPRHPTPTRTVHLG